MSVAVIFTQVIEVLLVIVGEWQFRRKRRWKRTSKCCHSVVVNKPHQRLKFMFANDSKLQSCARGTGSSTTIVARPSGQRTCMKLTVSLSSISAPGAWSLKRAVMFGAKTDCHSLASFPRDGDSFDAGQLESSRAASCRGQCWIGRCRSRRALQFLCEAGINIVRSAYQRRHVHQAFG